MAATVPPVIVPPPLPKSPTRDGQLYNVCEGSDVSDELLEACAELFSKNYGVWGSQTGTRAGKSVKMNGKRLRVQCLGVPKQTVLVTCFGGSELLGHAFATIWKYDGGIVGWITQLVVDVLERRHYIATTLLQTLKRNELFADITAIGLVSSHPAACNALAKYGSVSVDAIDTDFIRDNASKILSSTPVTYLSSAQLRGSLFQTAPEIGVVSSVYTEFFVDHREPLQALQNFKKRGKWALGELLDGHEFLVIIPITNLARLEM